MIITSLVNLNILSAKCVQEALCVSFSVTSCYLANYASANSVLLYEFILLFCQLTLTGSAG